MKANDRHEMIVGGTGGQGVITIGYALAEAASHAYPFVTRFPVYMATMRGGPAFCTVIFSKQEIPAQILSSSGNAVAMESGAYGRLKKEVKPGGRLFVNSSIVKKIEQSEQFRVYQVPVTDLAQDMGAPGMANMVMLGAYRTVSGVLDDRSVMRAVEKTLKAEGREERLHMIHNAYEAGVKFASAL